jgi:hypothetical protein
MAEAGILERKDLQRWIKNGAEAFFEEINEDELIFIGEEVEPSDFVRDRIDLLAMDGEGNLVVFELKRHSHKLQLLQAIAYAGMLAKKSLGRGKTTERHRQSQLQR